MATLSWKYRFTLRTVWIAVTVACVCLALGQAAGWLFLFVLGVYLVDRRISLRSCVVLSVIAGLLSVLPWFGLGRCGMRIPIYGTTRLPTLNLPTGLNDILQPLYGLAEFIMLVCLMFCGRDAGGIVASSGASGPLVRPFVVFAFWAALSVTFLVAGFVTMLGRRRMTHAGCPPTAVKED
jgi:hypothetical protein